MAAAFTKTNSPGIYRRGDSYVVKVRDRRGRQVSRTASTMAEAREIQSMLRADITRGEYRQESRTTFSSYAMGWIETYSGCTSRGFREQTRADYRRALTEHAIPYFRQMPLAEIEPRDIKAFAMHVTRKPIHVGTDRERLRSAASLRLVLAPLKALLATAFEDGLIRSNPAANVRIASPIVLADEKRARALSSRELRTLLGKVVPEWRPFIELLACTGLRIGEAVTLQWRDLDLQAGTLSVRRTVNKGELGPPKSRFGLRTIPLTSTLQKQLRERRLKAGVPVEDDPVFATANRTMHLPANLHVRGMKPPRRRRGLPGGASTRCATRSHRSCSPTAATSSRSGACWAPLVGVHVGPLRASAARGPARHAFPRCAV